MLHELKTWPDAFKAVWDGDKSFDLRKNDRGFEEGDSLLLREYIPQQGYTGRAVFCGVSYILKKGYGLPDGYCIMQLYDVRQSETGE